MRFARPTTRADAVSAATIRVQQLPMTRRLAFRCDTRVMYGGKATGASSPAIRGVRGVVTALVGLVGIEVLDPLTSVPASAERRCLPGFDSGMLPTTQRPRQQGPIELTARPNGALVHPGNPGINCEASHHSGFPIIVIPAANVAAGMFYRSSHGDGLRMGRGENGSDLSG